MSAYKTGKNAVSELPSPELPATNSSMEEIFEGQHRQTNYLLASKSFSLPRRIEPSWFETRSDPFCAGTYGRPLRARVKKTRMRQMFEKAKQMAAALFSHRRAHPPEPPHSPEEGYIAELQRKARADSIPEPVRSKKLWSWQQSQETRDRQARRMLRRMSPYSRERRHMTAESARKVMELEDERVAVRDFHPEFVVRDAKKNAERRAVREAKERRRLQGSTRSRIECRDEWHDAAEHA